MSFEIGHLKLENREPVVAPEASPAPSIIRHFVYILLLLTVLPVFAEDKLDTTALFNEANDAFAEATGQINRDPEAAMALYQKAALRFERIINEGGIHNGPLYYNLGNTYFRMNDMGRAILNYRRALQYTPNDINIKQNLSYARSRRMDTFAEEEAVSAVRTILLFWHYDISTGARTIIFIAAFLIFWMLAALRLFKPGAVPRWSLGIALVLALMFAGSLLYDSLAGKRDRAGVILAHEVIGRKGDGEAYQPSFKDPLHAGVEFNLIERRNDWLNVVFPDGRTCWIPAPAAELVSSQK